LNLDLSSVNAKLDWAEEHRKELHAEIRKWCQSDPVETIRTSETHGSKATIRYVAKFRQHPPLQRWGLMFGDFVHNARSALDHLVYAIAFRESGGRGLPENVQKKLAFPICDDMSKWKTRCFTVEVLQANTRARIEGVQPYNRPQVDALPKLLAVLRDFSDVDKHRVLKPEVCTLHRAQIEVQSPDGMRFGFDHDTHTGELIDGTVLHSATLSSEGVKGDTGDVYHNYRGEMFVALTHNPGPSGATESDILTLMRLLLRETREVIEILSR
jgi:hypothetical protein